MMQLLKGKPVSPGYAEGTAFLHNLTAVRDVPSRRIACEEADAELQRFHEALERSAHELKQAEHRVLSEFGQAQSAIFSAHLSILSDQQFVEKVKERVSSELMNVEQALDMEVDALVRRMNELEGEYLRQRAADIRDVGNRLMRQLVHRSGGEFLKLPPNSVIVATELLPSQTIDLDHRHLAAIITEQGGQNSHAAILARALGIPSVTGVADATARIAHGDYVLVDGETAEVTVKPSNSARQGFETSKKLYDRNTTLAEKAETEACKTTDGERVSLLANIGRISEAKHVARHNLDGVGLFRTEFLFMQSPCPPDSESQRRIYRQVAESLGGRPLVIRTLDLGGDKVPAFLKRQHTANPTLGLRGLRFSLTHRDTFETQLRAVIDTARDYDVRVLLPMVLGSDDLRRALEIVDNVVRQAGLPRRPKIGAMIETPSAVFMLNGILELADFVSIGTNDLTQFMLAADRNTDEALDHYSVLHPSVLRAIQQIIAAGHEANKPVCVCGEAAGYPRTACLLVGLGAREISMSPVRAARVRVMLRNASCRRLEELAAQAVRCSSTDEVRRLLAAMPIRF